MLPYCCHPFTILLADVLKETCRTRPNRCAGMATLVWAVLNVILGLWSVIERKQKKPHASSVQRYHRNPFLYLLVESYLLVLIKSSAQLHLYICRRHGHSEAARFGDKEHMSAQWETKETATHGKSDVDILQCIPCANERWGRNCRRRLLDVRFNPAQGGSKLCKSRG